MGLDASTRKLLDLAAAAGRPNWWEIPLAQAREEFNAARRAQSGPPLESVATTDTTIPGPAGPLGVRVFRPKSASPKALLPALVYFHGGGWVLGSPASHDNVGRWIAEHSGCAVVSVDYRLAPEHPFPAAYDDSLAAVRWVAANGATLGVDGHRIAVGGDSAGGNLAAAVAIAARDEGGPKILYQLLAYPVVDTVTTTGSYALFAEGYFLTRDRMANFFEHYIGGPGATFDWRAAPLRAASLANLPPAMVLTAGFDPLRDEGRAYAQRLQADGVAVDYVEYGDLIHGFFGQTGVVPTSQRALRFAALALAEHLHEGEDD